MDKKYKAYNRNKYDVGVQFMDAHKQMNVKAGSFVLLTEEEISFLHSISTTFSGKELSVDEEEIRVDLLGFLPEERMTLSEEDILTMFKGSLPKMKKDFEKITEPNFKYLIFEAAKKQYSELSGAKSEYIAEFCGRDSEDLKPVKEETENEAK
jgi:hypothetical protein